MRLYVEVFCRSEDNHEREPARPQSLGGNNGCRVRRVAEVPEGATRVLAERPCCDEEDCLMVRTEVLWEAGL